MNHLIRCMVLTMMVLALTWTGSAQNCSDSEACNYNPDFGTPSVCLNIDTVAVHTEGDLAGMTTYRVYVQSASPDDFVTAVFGNDNLPLSLTTTTSFHQDALGGASAQAINPLLLPAFPNLAFDSYVTIGLTQTASTADGENGPSLVGSPNQDWAAIFDPGGGAPGDDIVIDDIIGGLWFIYNGDANGYPDNQGQILLAQLTTDGLIGGTLNVQYFPAGGAATTATFHLDELCAPPAEEDCTYPAPNEDCDGACLNDADSDGICDEVDPCIGTVDACGVCNGPGAIQDCGCDPLPAGACDCEGNTLDALGVCGGDCAADADNDSICDDQDPCVGTPDAIGVCNGTCTADADNDGVCDDVDSCIGQLDECGICNGPGATGECGCDDFPDGACDCAGNTLDALGVCGGGCAADADNDNICDDEDPCIGAVDACGICNGPGAIYDCGCSEQPAGDCDCDGNQLDAVGVCGGDCPADEDGNGVCDNLEGSGCADESACNFDPYAEPVVSEPITDYCLLTEVVAEHTAGTLAGMTTYRVSIQTLHPTDFVTSVSGNSGSPTRVFTTTSFYQDPFGGVTPENINPLLLPTFPDLAYDSWITIGLEGPADASVGENSIAVVNSPNQSWSLAFEPGGGQPGSDLIIDDLIGGVWYILNGDANGVPDENGRVLLGQFTTDGGLTGNLQVQVFPQGDNGNFLLLDLPLGLGVGCPSGGSNETCLYGDALGACGGDCEADVDEDGTCDDVDQCVGSLDDCGVCNGSGAIYDCGCADIPAGDCDCEGNQADALGVCGGDCIADADADGLCDDVDPCVGVVDECGVCNGPGAVGDCGCEDIPDGACDCAGNTLDALGVCGGDCTADVDADGICDDVDPCVGAFDDCGICNGQGAIYDCGCAGIPDGDCDCDGNQLDAIGVCGGECTADVDADGICDDVDPCVGAFDDCGICDGPGAIYDCGCADIPDGDCDCDGNQLDAIGDCGGDCQSDANGNGICDVQDVPGCTYPDALNYNVSATMDNGSCEYEPVVENDCPGDLTGDGAISIQDLLDFLIVYGGFCD